VTDRDGWPTPRSFASLMIGPLRPSERRLYMERKAMKTLIRSLIVVAVFVVALAALRTVSATTPDATPPVSSPSTPPSQNPSADPSTAPSEEPAETPDESADVVGTFTMVDGVATTGPGIGLEEALANPTDQPVLVRGALFKEVDGTLFLAASVTDGSAPTFGGPLVRVLGYPESAPEWDLANAELTGLQEANGILFFEDARLFGVIELDA
jgi:hypothetical protein